MQSQNVLLAEAWEHSERQKASAKFLLWVRVHQLIPHSSLRNLNPAETGARGSGTGNDGPGPRGQTSEHGQPSNRVFPPAAIVSPERRAQWAHWALGGGRRPLRPWKGVSEPPATDRPPAEAGSGALLREPTAHGPGHRGCARPDAEEGRVTLSLKGVHVHNATAGTRSGRVNATPKATLSRRG